MNAEPSPTAITVRDDEQNQTKMNQAKLEQLIKNEKSSNDYTEIWSGEPKDDKENMSNNDESDNNADEVLSLKSQLEERESQLYEKE